jgi:uncharacterized membrane protein
LGACALLAVGIGSVIYSYRGMPRSRALISLRLVVGLLICGMLFEPALQLRVVRRIEDRIAIIVDQSASMKLAAMSQTTRWQRLQTLVAQSAPQLATLSQTHSLDWYDLKGPIDPNALSAHAPQGDTTDLLQALQGARQAATGKPLAGFVLLSDGADNQGLHIEPENAGKTQSDPKIFALGAPVNTIDITADADFTYKDLAITEVVADAFGFIQNTFTIDVSLLATGFEGDKQSLRIPVTLKREGQILSTQEVRLQPGKLAHCVFQIKPDAIGEFIYSVDVPAQDGEATLDNNSQQFVVQVIRDKIRVLQVSGRPSWDERFLRQYLKENPNTDLVSFFILRTPSDDTSIAESELSLIPFPVNKLFTTELKNFDVIIFQNFDFRPYRMAHYLPNIRDAVQSGLGFVMLGGDASFSDGGFLGTAIDDILPVRLDDKPMRFGTVTPKLTQAGLRHPIMDMGQGDMHRAELFAALPPWTSANSMSMLTPGATSLAEDAAPEPGTAPTALIAAMDAGKGRTLSVATDALWRWQFAFGPNGAVSARAYQRFWSNALRWLVRDPEHAHIRIVPAKRRYEAGEPVQAAITVVDNDYQPVAKTTVSVDVETVGDNRHAAHTVTTGEGGIAHLRLEDMAQGAYRLTAKAHIHGLGVMSGSGVFVIDATSLEMRDGAPRPEVLQALADATHGRALAPEPKSFGRLQLVDPQVVQIDKRRNIELWDNLWAMGALLALFIADWTLRRRRGFF